MHIFLILEGSYVNLASIDVDFSEFHIGRHWLRRFEDILRETWLLVLIPFELNAAQRVWRTLSIARDQEC